MSVIYILIIISMVVAAIFLGAFIWASKSGQFDDTYSPSVRILFDDKKKKYSDKEEDKESKKNI